MRVVVVRGRGGISSPAAASRRCEGGLVVRAAAAQPPLQLPVGRRQDEHASPRPSSFRRTWAAPCTSRSRRRSTPSVSARSYSPAARPVAARRGPPPTPGSARPPAAPRRRPRSTKWYSRPSCSPVAGRPRGVGHREAQARQLLAARAGGRWTCPPPRGRRPRSGWAARSTQRSAPARGTARSRLLRPTTSWATSADAGLAADACWPPAPAPGPGSPGACPQGGAQEQLPGLGHVAAQPLQLLAHVVPVHQPAPPPGRAAALVEAQLLHEGAHALVERRLARLPRGAVSASIRSVGLGDGRERPSRSVWSRPPSARRMAIQAVQGLAHQAEERSPPSVVEGGRCLHRPPAPPGSAPRPKRVTSPPRPCSACTWRRLATRPATTDRLATTAAALASGTLACTGQLDPPPADPLPARRP